jgi:hypothetical protein
MVRHNKKHHLEKAALLLSIYNFWSELTSQEKEFCRKLKIAVLKREDIKL